MSEPHIAHCPTCGVLMFAGDNAGPCAACVQGQYGGDENHEGVRLFTPAPTQMEGQQTLL